MGESNMLGVSGREDGEMSWKEANTGSGRDKKERNQWKGVKKKKWVPEENVKTWEETCCDG